MALALSVTLAGCGTTAQTVPASREPVRVSNAGQPFQMWEGGAARTAADAKCGGSVKTSIYDRYDRATGEWVYPEGCA